MIFIETTKKYDIQTNILYKNLEILTTQNVKCLNVPKIAKPKIMADVYEKLYFQDYCCVKI